MVLVTCLLYAGYNPPNAGFTKLITGCCILALPVGTAWHTLIHTHTRHTHAYIPMCIYTYTFKQRLTV